MFFFFSEMADDEYICSLDANSLKKAKLELYEESKDRLSALRTFREWIDTQKWLKTPTGISLPVKDHIVVLE